MNNIKSINSCNNNFILNLDKLIDDYSSYLRTIIANYASIQLSNEDIEEILIDTFLVFWKNYSNTTISYPKAYLVGIAKNLVRQKSKNHHFTYDISDFENTLPYNDNIDYILEKREKIRNLQISYKSLNETDFKILSLFYYNLKSTKDISKELNISESNVRTRLVRIRKKLKKILGGNNG